MVMKPNYVLTEKMANHGSEVSASNVSDRVKKTANGNAAFNRTENADYLKVAEADAVFEDDGVLVLDRAVKLESGDYGLELPGSTYLAFLTPIFFASIYTHIEVPIATNQTKAPMTLPPEKQIFV
jgi:hypothetical protein